VSQDEPEWVSLVLEAYTKPNQTKPNWVAKAQTVGIFGPWKDEKNYVCGLDIER
jgi:hypothetical protein